MSTEWIDCGGAHEISGIKAPLFLCGGGVVGWVVVLGVGASGVGVGGGGGGGSVGGCGVDGGVGVRCMVCW